MNQIPDKWKVPVFFMNRPKLSLNNIMGRTVWQVWEKWLYCKAAFKTRKKHLYSHILVLWYSKCTTRWWGGGGASSMCGLAGGWTMESNSIQFIMPPHVPSSDLMENNPSECWLVYHDLFTTPSRESFCACIRHFASRMARQITWSYLVWGITQIKPVVSTT